MLRDAWLTRLFLQILTLSLDSIAPLSGLYLILSLLCAPAPAAVVFTAHLPLDRALDALLALDKALPFLTLYCAAEALWWAISATVRVLLDRGWWDFRGDSHEEITSEERWRLWRNLVESAKDPWEWIGGFFLAPGHKRAPAGAADPALQRVKPEQVGRTNVEEFIAHFMFRRRLRDLKKQPKSLAAAELHSMVLLLEAQFTLSRASEGSAPSQPFHFLRGRSPHRVFQLSREPLTFGHHPLLFYAMIRIASVACSCALYLAGFRYYASRRSLSFPPWTFGSSRRSLESILDPLEAEKMGDARLAERMGYWYKPARADRLEEDAKPLIFCHGISGLAVVTPFVLGLSWLSGRAIFIPELPYLSMRLSPPSAILTRLEYVATVRRMLWAHGFGLTSLDPTEDDESYTSSEDGEEWRRAKAVVVAHSFGTGAAAWLPDLLGGLVLMDPMSILLFAADSPRNFFRTKCRTAGELFFRYFALERGINHFLSRHLRWSDSVLFGPKAPAPLPQRVVDAFVPACAREPLDPPHDVPFYAGWVSPAPEGPLPTVIFLAEKDCILPVAKIHSYLLASGFTDSDSAPPPPYSEKNGSSTGDNEVAKNGDAPVAPSLRIMHNLEHGAVLGRWDWCKEVAKAVEGVAAAAEGWEEDD
ncbi:hypothetical protein JCM10213v2_000434 [Rhodosporidiobolus nylandii]